MILSIFISLDSFSLTFCSLKQYNTKSLNSKAVESVTRTKSYKNEMVWNFVDTSCCSDLLGRSLQHSAKHNTLTLHPNVRFPVSL